MSEETPETGGFRRATDSRIRVEKTVFPAAEPVPVVAYVVENEWPTSVAVRVSDRIPDDVPASDVGFRKVDFDDWTIREDGTLTYATTIDEGSVARSAVFIRHQPFPGDAISEAEPVLSAVEAVTPNGSSVEEAVDHDGIDTADRSVGGEPDAGDTPTGSRPEATTDAPAATGSAPPEQDTDDAETAAGTDTVARSEESLDAEPPDELHVPDPDVGSDEAEPSQAAMRADEDLERFDGADEDPERSDGADETLQVDPTAVTDESAAGRWDASTVQIEVIADASEVNFDGQRERPWGGSGLPGGTFGPIERRLGDVEDAVKQVEVEATNANIKLANGADADTEVSPLLEECKAAARKARRAVVTIRDHVDAVATAGRSIETDRALSRLEGESVGHPSSADPPDLLPGRDQSEAVDASSRTLPMPEGSGSPDTAGRRPAYRDGEPGGVRIEMVGRNGDSGTWLGAVSGRAPSGGEGRIGTARYVDVRELAMDEDEYTFDELIVLGSDLFR